jgi:HlyD family secretion protein
MKKLFVLAVILVLTAACMAVWGTKRKNGHPQYKTTPAKLGNITVIVTATGTVNPVTTVLVGTQVSGTIKKLYADYNSYVKQGQLVAQIDPDIFQAQVDQAKANLKAAQAGQVSAEATLALALKTYDRNKELVARDLIAKSDFDTADSAHEVAKAQVSTAKGQVAQTEAALRQAQVNLDHTRITSPVNGTVIARNVDVGQTVAASFQTPTLFTIAQDLTKMQIDTSVNEADIGRIRVGQTVEFSVDAYPEQTFRGSVAQVRNAPTTVQNVVTYDVVVAVANPELKLKPGMTANVSIITDRKNDVLLVPNAAFRFKPDTAGKERDRQPGVWLLVDGKPKKTPVTTGLNDGSNTEIVSGGIKEGDPVIIEAVKNGKTGQAAARPPGMRMF